MYTLFHTLQLQFRWKKTSRARRKLKDFGYWLFSIQAPLLGAKCLPTSEAAVLSHSSKLLFKCFVFTPHHPDATVVGVKLGLKHRVTHLLRYLKHFTASEAVPFFFLLFFLNYRLHFHDWGGVGCLGVGGGGWGQGNKTDSDQQRGGTVKNLQMIRQLVVKRSYLFMFGWRSQVNCSCGVRCAAPGETRFFVSSGLIKLNQHSYYYYWSLLYSTILRSRADSLRSHVILYEWIAFYSAFFEYPPKWCTYSAGMAGATRICCQKESILVRSVYTIQPCTVSLHAKPHT